MFQGTGSGVGKSIITAAFCRMLARQGLRVAPFKAQNMALNSFVTHDGLEMGRAQVFQAEACGIRPDVRMNPVLIKPTKDARSQVIIMGMPQSNYSASEYYKYAARHRRVAQEAFDSLSADFDVIVMEGAGSPAEINLQKYDIVNMAMAAHAGAPVIIVGDIDRGGFFAWIKGTYDLVRPEDRFRIKGFLVNKFRGDVNLLTPGIEDFQKIVPIRCLGVLPWFYDISVDQEDGVYVKDLEREQGEIRVAVIHLPRISNFTDFAPLTLEPDVSLTFVRFPHELRDPDCVIIPGTKATRADLVHMLNSGWADTLNTLARKGVTVLGICGGYQIMGTGVDDPNGVEGEPGFTEAIGLLPIVTSMSATKKLEQVLLNLCHPAFSSGEEEVSGYEIHMGHTVSTGEYVPLGPGLDASFGAAHPTLDVIGTYLHGIFENDRVRRGFINQLRKKKGLAPVEECRSYRAFKEKQFDRLADWLENNADVTGLMEFVKQ